EGDEGTLISPACAVAADPEDDHPVGAILVTMTTRKDFFWFDFIPPGPAPSGSGPDPAEELAHLTWVFVNPWYARCGVGSALLAAAAEGLIALGHRRLYSSFLLGNESSTLWHWTRGFRPLPYPGSMRNIRRQGRAGDGPD